MFKNILHTSGMNLVILVINIITGIFLARLLGPTQRGELAAAQTFVSFLITICLLGLPQAVVYSISRKPEKSKQTVVTVLWLFIPITIFTCLSGYFLIPFALSAQSAEVIQNARIYLFSIVGATFGSIYLWGFQGLQEFRYWNLMRLFSGIIWFLAILSGYASGKLSPRYLILFMLVIPIPFIFIFTRIFWKYLRGHAEFNLKRARQVLGYGLPLTLSSLPHALNLRLDQILMAGILAPNFLGLYLIGVTWSGAPSILLSAIGSVVFPKISSLSESTERRRIMGMTTSLSVLIAVIILILQLFVTPFAIPLVFGNEYAPAVPSAMVLVVAGGVVGLNAVWSDILNGLGHPEALLYAEIIGLVVTAVALSLLLRPFQLMGAALASLLSYTISFGYLSLALNRYTQLPLHRLVIPTLADCIVVNNRARQAILSVWLAGKQLQARTRKGGGN